jgi:hypothetical protein
MLLIALLAGLVLWGVLTFNRLVRDRNQVRSAWSDIDVQLTRRHDLVPQLVEAVRAYANYERATLSAVTELRTRAEAAGSLRDKARLEDEMEAGLHRLIALAEAYPELKGRRQFPAIAARPRRDGGPPAVRAPLLQRRGAHLQHAHRELPRHAGREAVRVLAGGVLRGG